MDAHLLCEVVNALHAAIPYDVLNVNIVTYQGLYVVVNVYDTLIAQPWLRGVIAQIRGEKAIPGVDAGDEKAVKKRSEEHTSELQSH